MEITALARHSRRTLRSLLTAFVALMAVAGLMVVAAPAASAVPPGYRPNGCTLSPDRGWTPVYFDFKSACDAHDYCYDDMWYGPGENGRYACDIYFVNRMSAWCNNTYSAWYLAWERGKCGALAQVYFGAVRVAGKPYFNNPNLN